MKNGNGMSSAVKAVAAAFLLAFVQTSRACPFCYEGRVSDDLHCTGLHEWKEGSFSYGWYWEWSDLGGRTWYYHGVDGYDWYDGGLMPLGLWSPVSPDVPAQENPMPAQAASRDPVNLLTGRVTDSATDLELPSPLVPLSFSRNYVSGTDGDAALGRGWRHSLDVRVCATTNGTPFLSRPDGTTASFASTSGTGRDWRSLGDEGWLLRRGTNGVWTLDAPGSGSAEFATNGLLSSISDGCGNSLALSRGAGGRLERVARNGEAALSLSYSGGLLARVSTPDPSYFAEYGHDAAGNVGVATNRVSVAVVTDAAYAWDAAGCLTNRIYSDSSGGAATASYSWTDDYRLSRAATNGVTACSFEWDALGDLVAFSNAAGRVACLVEDGHVLADVGADGRPLRVYVRTEGVDGWLGFVDLSGGVPRGRWFVSDAAGCVRAVVDDGGEVLERYDCDAWGRVLRIEGADGVPRARSAIGNRIVWQGREWFPDAELHFFRERWYDPVVGRWVSEDPIGLAGGLNLYEFCGGDPVNYCDPNGLGKVTFLAKNSKGIWHAISKSRAGKLIQEHKTIRAVGHGARYRAKRLIEKVTGKRVVRHDGHRPGEHSHMQNKNGTGAHVQLLGAHLLSGTVLGDVLDFFNPISDVEDSLNFILDIREYLLDDECEENRK